MTLYDILITPRRGNAPGILLRRNMSYSEAMEFCEEHGWRWNTGDRIWDLAIEESGYEVLYGG